MVFALILGGLDVVAVAALSRVADTDAARPTPGLFGAGAAGGAPDVPTVSGWALCQTQFAGAAVKPASVAISYLDTQVDLYVLPNEIRRWFGSLDPSVVDVYKLETKRGVRRIAFEVQRGKWPRWDEVAAGLQGEEICGAVRAALLDAGVGRARPADVIKKRPGGTGSGADSRADNGANSGADSGAPGSSGSDPASDVAAQRSRYDFEFIYARRRQLYRQIEWIGSLDYALELDNFVELRQWLHSGS